MGGDKRIGKLGKWFPKASVVKGAASFDPDVTAITILLFYQYVTPRWSEQRKEAAIAHLEELALRLRLGGRLRVAQEGVNATVTGTHSSIEAFTAALQAFDQSFANTDFKYIKEMPLDRAFNDMKVQTETLTLTLTRT